MKQAKYYPFIILIFPLLFTSCHEASKKVSAVSDAATAVMPSAVNTSCPYLTHDAAGRPVLSWIAGADSGRGPQLYYAVYSDSTQAFGAPQLVSSSSHLEPHGENMPKIIYQPNGNMLAVYGVKNPQPGNPYTGAVFYTRSFDGGKTWSAAQPLVRDSTESFDQRYFDVALLPDGNVAIVWLNNSKPEGSTLYFASTEGRSGFGQAKILARHSCQCCRTALLVDSAGNIHVAWRNIFQDSIRDMAYCVSRDSGRTFSAAVRISADNWVVNGCPHTGPSMAMNTDALHFAWFTMGGGGGVYYAHKDQDGTFSPRQVVSNLSSARHPEIVTLPDNDLAIVWDEGVRYGNTVHQRIGLQMRGPGGLLLDTRHLTPDSIDASFAQLSVLSSREGLLAFTRTAADRQQVMYRLVTLQP